MEQTQLLAKVIIRATLTVKTGLHVGGSNDYAPIGAVDHVFIRDPLTKQPVIPGSSVKGKMRTLLAKTRNGTGIGKSLDNDEEVVLRLFGSAKKGNILFSRLQFSDSFVSTTSMKQFSPLDTDTYLGEVKFENSIDRATGGATPRQIERVPAGMQFDFQLVYNLEKIEDFDEDMTVLQDGFRLLQLDYLGGHGSRGYGRVAFSHFDVKKMDARTGKMESDVKLAEQFKGSCL